MERRNYLVETVEFVLICLALYVMAISFGVPNMFDGAMEHIDTGIKVYAVIGIGTVMIIAGKLDANFMIGGVTISIISGVAWGYMMERVDPSTSGTIADIIMTGIMGAVLGLTFSFLALAMLSGLAVMHRQSRRIYNTTLCWVRYK